MRRDMGEGGTNAKKTNPCASLQFADSHTSFFCVRVCNLQTRTKFVVRVCNLQTRTQKNFVCESANCRLAHVCVLCENLQIADSHGSRFRMYATLADNIIPIHAHRYRPPSHVPHIPTGWAPILHRIATAGCQSGIPCDGIYSVCSHMGTTLT